MTGAGLGKTVMLTILAVLGAVIALAMTIAAKVPGAAAGYRACYEQSMRDRDFSFDACRVHTENIKREYKVESP